MQSANTDDTHSASRFAAPSPEFLERFFAAADRTDTPTENATQTEQPQIPNALRFDHFMRLALYDETVGYYAQPNLHRVGRRPGTDFYTATNVGTSIRSLHSPRSPSSGEAPTRASPEKRACGPFGELVVQSCLTLMGEAFCARATFIEIGAERGQGILKNLAHPFAAARTISLGQPIELLGEIGKSDTPLIVFSNELFDAQACRRFVWREGRDKRSAQNGQRAYKTGWCETYVRAENGTLSEIEHPLERVPKFLPKTAPVGYRIDAPLDASALLDQIASQPWHGLFLAFDYGKTWAELTEATPQGTARAYTQHRQTNALLAQPGQQDLTCHICWDWLQDGLAAAGFRDIALETQEAFFVKHSGTFIAQQIAADAHKLSAKKQALLQLLHPAHLGQKFQVLRATR